MSAEQDGWFTVKTEVFRVVTSTASNYTSVVRTHSNSSPRAIRLLPSTLNKIKKDMLSSVLIFKWSQFDCCNR